MLILLPPSETKTVGGAGGPLDLGGLGWPHLTAARTALLDAVVAVTADPAAARRALGLSPGQHAEIDRDRLVRISPTTPAIERYAGVLYDALGYRHLGPAGRRRADERLVVGSALFGLLRARDAIPAYRLSADSRLPGIGSLPGYWRASVSAVLATAPGPIVDLRSAAYVALAPCPTAITVRITAAATDGTRGVVSHQNKATKGLVARALVSSRAEPRSATDVARMLRAAGFDCTRAGGALEISQVGG